MNVPFANGNELPVRRQHLYPVILCGGSGTRLWPLSREAYPKQLLALLSQQTLLQETVERTRKGLGLGAPILLCNETQRFLVAEQLEDVGVVPEVILCEPTSRNTAPALAAAALYLDQRDPDAIMLALPSDHYVGDVPAFAEAVKKAVASAEQGRLVTFGIRPTRPETGYGYIQRGALLNNASDVYAVARFVEKPDRATADNLLADGSYLWNSGMFVLPAGPFLDELKRYGPETMAACSAAFDRCQKKNGSMLLDAEAFAGAPTISVDYAVMEHTDRAAVVPADIGWSDIGSWQSLHDASAQDESGNVFSGDVVTEDVRNSYIRSNGRLVAAIGLDGMVVVDTDDALLVSNAARASEVGELAKRLKAARRPESQHHKRVYRPWGYYECLDNGDRFQVKHIMVKPGGQLSLQMHHHRAEHWVVVSGTARVICGDDSRLMGENESRLIPLGAAHRLENPGKLPLHLIEVQVGSYLGEDDIVRFEDTYGRA